MRRGVFLTTRWRYRAAVLAWFALGASTLLHQDRPDAWMYLGPTVGALVALTVFIESLRCRACGAKVWMPGRVLNRYLLPPRCRACGEPLG